MPPKNSLENAFLLKIRPMHVQNILFSSTTKDTTWSGWYNRGYSPRSTTKRWGQRKKVSSGAFCLPGANASSYKNKMRMATSGGRPLAKPEAVSVPSAVSVGAEGDN